MHELTASAVMGFAGQLEDDGRGPIYIKAREPHGVVECTWPPPNNTPKEEQLIAERLFFFRLWGIIYVVAAVFGVIARASWIV
jgi:hypothetical protein